jgi:hypothetical protein
MRKPTVKEMHDHTFELLRLWLVAEDKIAFSSYYNKMTHFEQNLFLEALKDVISESENEEFRKAAKDIPEYIKEIV